MKIGRRLRKIIEQRGLSSAQVARLSGIPQQRLSDWLADVSVRDMHKLKAVCNTLGITIDDLLFTELDVELFPSAKVNLWTTGVFEIKIRRLK